MTANGLRVNNWVKIISKDKFYQITRGYEIERYKHFEPIELTEDILSKIKGSITKVKPLETEIYLGLLYWVSSIPKSVFITTNGFNDIEISCDYLHQLQNLYFELTNEELEIKL